MKYLTPSLVVDLGTTLGRATIIGSGCGGEFCFTSDNSISGATNMHCRPYSKAARSVVPIKLITRVSDRLTFNSRISVFLYLALSGFGFLFSSIKSATLHEKKNPAY